MSVLKFLGVLGVLGVALWAIFRWVITNESMLLAYLRVLTWPALLAVALYAFHVPLRERLAHLLKVEAFGASADFAATGAARLDAAIRPDVDALVASDEPDPLDSAVKTPPSVNADVGETTDAVVATPRPPRSEPTEGGAPEGLPIPHKPADEELVAVVLRLTEAAGLSAVSRSRLAEGLNDGTVSKSEAIDALVSAIRTLRHERNVAAHSSPQSRSSLESVIQKSAAWGYEMGKAGAPEAIPDIEWNPDGSWSITTEIPQGSVKRRDQDRRVRLGTSGKSEHRAIAALEKEIKDLEKAKHSPVAAARLGVLTNSGWLTELKARLRSVDPGNPWAD